MRRHLFTAQQKPSPGLTANPLHPLAPTVAWLLNEGAGLKVNNWTGIDAPGTLTNGPLWVGGAYGTTVRFDGANDYIDCLNPDKLAIGTQSFTMVARIRSDATQSSGAGVITYDTAGISRLAALEAHVDGIGVQLYDGSANPFVRAGTIKNTGWRTIAATRGGGLLRIFIDGAQVGQANDTAGNLTTSGMLWSIGRRRSLASFFNGWIEYAYLYVGQALSTSMLTWLHAEPYSMFLPQRLTRGVQSVAGFQAAWAQGSNRLISGGVWGG